MYSYTDPCTQELKTIVYDMSAPIVVSYYGETRAFTYNEMQDGTFDSWLTQVYSNYTAQPCQGVLTTVTTTSTTNITTNVINTVLNLNTITSSLTALGGIGNNLGGTVNLGSNNNNSNNNSNENKGNNNSNSSTSTPNNPSSNGSSAPSTNGNTGNSNPNSPGSSSSSGENSNNSSNNSGSNNSGGNTGENGSNSGNTGNSGNNNSSGNSGSGTSTNSGNNSSSGGNSSQENSTPSQEEIKTQKTEEQKATSNNVSKNTSKAKTETQKPAILVTGDIVGLQKTEDGSQDARGTVSYTRVKGDGTASLGISADYMVNAKIGNITIIKSWIVAKPNGDKHINLVSSGFSMMPGSISNTSMFIRINSLKRFTALYGGAASYGRLYQEELISTLAIAGFMYKGKIAKKIDGTIIVAGVYPPYTKYYTGDWFKSNPIIVPFFNFNYKLTKTFGLGLTGGTTYMAGQNVLNYQVLLGAKLIL
jgi:hypothetical protein